eukprot:scaffold986_cov237-Pinguiococcus_pyrenoidosus.AAC.18
MRLRRSLTRLDRDFVRAIQTQTREGRLEERAELKPEPLVANVSASSDAWNRSRSRDWRTCCSEDHQRIQVDGECPCRADDSQRDPDHGSGLQGSWLRWPTSGFDDSTIRRFEDLKIRRSSPSHAPSLADESSQSGENAPFL